MNTKKKLIFRAIVITIALVLMVIVESMAQLNPFGSIYYQNEYLSNPSLVGEDQRLNISLALKKQWVNGEGTPAMQALSVDYGISERVGIGGAVSNDKAGLLQRSRATISMAYRLPVSGYGDIISLGIGTGVFFESFDYSKFKGDDGDQSIASYVARPAYLDADVGLAYENNGFKIQGSIPNVKRFLIRDKQRAIINRSTFYSAISYRYSYDYSMWFDYIEGKAAYRGIEGYKGLLDVGFNINFLGGDLIFNTMYHSSQSLTFGAGTIIDKSIQLVLYYTTNSSKVQNYQNGEFEIGVKYSIFGSRGYNSGVNKDRF